MSGVAAGDFSHLFALQRPIGVDPTSYTVIDAAVWGGIRAVRGYEALRFGVTASEGHRVISIHWRDDLRATDRLSETDTDRRFEVVAYDDPTDEFAQLDVLVVEAL